MGRAADLQIKFDERGFRELANAMADIGGIDKDAAFKKALNKVALSPIRRDAKNFASSDTGKLRAAINTRKPFSKTLGVVLGLVGVAIGRKKDPRHGFAHIMEFGRSAFFQIVTAPNGKKYSVRIGPTKGDHMLTRAIEKNAPQIPVRVGKEIARIAKKKAKMAAQKAKVGS